MPLKKCPYCGGAISDTAKSCVHCGGLLGSVPNENKIFGKQSAETPAKVRKSKKTVLYTQLSEQEKIALDRRFFYEENKIYGKNLDSINSVILCRSAISLVVFVTGICFIVAKFVFGGNVAFANNLLFYFFLGMIIVNVLVGIVSFIVFGIILYNLNNKKIVSLKKYRDWLAKKNIDFEPTFISSRHLRYYSSIASE